MRACVCLKMDLRGLRCAHNGEFDYTKQQKKSKYKRPQNRQCQLFNKVPP